jgi:anti-sigma factor RsiW
MSRPEPSKCDSLLASLSDYVDGTLSDKLCLEIEQHMAECQDCHIVVDTLKKTVTLVHDCTEDCAELPDQVRERLFKTLNLEDYLEKE